MKNLTISVVLSHKTCVPGSWEDFNSLSLCGRDMALCGSGRPAFMGETLPLGKTYQGSTPLANFSRMVIDHFHVGSVYVSSKFIIRPYSCLTSSWDVYKKLVIRMVIDDFHVGILFMLLKFVVCPL